MLLSWKLSLSLFLDLMKMAQVYFRPEAIYLFGQVQTPYGWFAQVPSIRLNTYVLPAELGTLILQLLDELPDDRRNLDIATCRKEYESHLQALGFETLRLFARNAQLASVRTDGKTIQIVPYENNGRGTFLPLNEKSVTVEWNNSHIGSELFKCKIKK